MAEQDFRTDFEHFLVLLHDLDLSNEERATALKGFQKMLSDIVNVAALAVEQRRTAAAAASALQSAASTELATASSAPRRASIAGVIPDEDDTTQLEDLVAEKLYQHGDPRSLFLEHDIRRDGQLSPDELRVALADVGLVLTRPEAWAIVRKYDKDNTGTFDYLEFLAAYAGADGGGASRRSMSEYDTAFTPRMHTGSRPAELEPSARIVRQTEEQRLRSVSAGVRSKLARLYDSPTRAFLDLNRTREVGGHGGSWLSIDELQVGLSRHGLNLSKGDLVAITSPFSLARPGYLSVSEFTRFFQSRAGRHRAEATRPATAPPSAPAASGPGAPPLPTPIMGGADAGAGGFAPDGARGAVAAVAAAGGSMHPAAGMALFKYAHEHGATATGGYGGYSAYGGAVPATESVTRRPISRGRAPVPSPLPRDAVGFAPGAGGAADSKDAETSAPLVGGPPPDTKAARAIVNDVLYRTGHTLRHCYKSMHPTKEGVTPSDFLRGIQHYDRETKLTLRDVAALFAESELSHTGRLSYHEFVHLLSG